MAFQSHRGRAGDARKRGVKCISIIKLVLERKSRSGLVDDYFADLSTAADGACDVPADAVGKLCFGLRWWRSLVFLLIAQRGALEVNAVTAVHDTVQNRIGQGRIVQVGMPGLDWELAGDQG